MSQELPGGSPNLFLTENILSNSLKIQFAWSASKSSSFQSFENSLEGGLWLLFDTGKGLRVDVLHAC